MVPCEAVITVAFLIIRSAGAVELCAVAAAVPGKEHKKTPAKAHRGVVRRIEGLIRDYLLKKEAKGNATIVACS
jgi:hypothetical protein